MLHSRFQRLLSNASNPLGRPLTFGFFSESDSTRSHVLKFAAINVAVQPRLGFATQSGKQTEKEKAKKLKDKEKAQKEKEKEKEKAQKEKEKEQLRKEKEKQMKAKEKEKAVRAKEKEKEKKEKEKEKLRKQKEKEKLKKEMELLKRKEKKSDGKPKRAPSAFSFFVKDKMPSVRLQNPDLSIPEAMVKVAAQWKALDDAGRQKYATEHEQAMKARKEQLAAWEATRPPKKALSGYSAFIKQNFSSFKEKNPDAPFPEISKLVAKKWSTLSQSEKENYNKK